MPLSSRAKRITITAGVLVILTASLLLAVVPVLIERWLNQYDLQEAFNKTSGGTISTGTLKLHVFPTPHLIIPAGSLDLPDLLIGRWQEIRIYPALKTILSGKIRFQKLKIITPDIQLNANFIPEVENQADMEMGRLTSEHMQGVLQEASRRMGKGLQWLATHSPEASVRVRNGRMQLPAKADMAPVAFHDIDARLTLPPDALQIELDCKSSFLRALRVTGAVDASSLAGKLTLWFNQLDTAQLSEITDLKRSFDHIGGLLSGHMTVDLIGPSKIESHITFRLPQLTLQRLDTPVTIRNAFIDGVATFNASSLRFDLARLYAEQPRLSLTGHLQMGGEFAGLRLHLVGSRIDIAEARQATLALAGDSQRTVKIFDVLRAGSVPWISWRTEGARIGDLGVFNNMKLTGEVQNGELYIPAADLQLTDVNGIADIAEGVLRGDGLSARVETTEGREGKLWIDFAPDGIPFFLEIDTHLKDVGMLPPRLLTWVDDDNFRSEIKRLNTVRGEARGMLILDSRKGDGLEVTADVGQCRLTAEYDRIPWEVSIDKGLVLYTNDRITLDQMTGRIGPSTFEDLKARVDFGGESWLHIESARAVLDLGAVIPWIMSFEDLRSVARQYRIAGDRAEITGLSLEGPFFEPSRWTFATRGRIDRLTLAADDLPGPLNLSDLRLRASENSLNAENLKLELLDADVTGSAQATFADSRLQSYDLDFKGQLGQQADKWLNDLFEEDADFYLTQTPLTVSAASINWAAGRPFDVAGDFKTSQGVQVSLSQEWFPEKYRKERVEIKDGEAVAIVSRDSQSDQLNFGFEGLLTGKTLNRLLLRNPFPSGRLNGDFQIGIVAGRPELSTTRGHLTAANIRLPLEGDHKVHISQLQLTAENNRLKISPAAFLVNDSWHTLEGDIRLASQRYHVDLRHEGAFLDIPAPEEAQHQEGRSQLDWLLNLPLDGKIQSRFSALKWGDQRWVPMEITAAMAPGKWVIEVDEAGLCGIQTSGTVVLAPDTVSVDLKHEARKASLKPAVSCLLDKPDLIDGRLSLKGHLKGQAPIEGLKDALEGQFKFEAEDGRIYRFDLLGRILATINLTELVRGQKSDLMGEGLAYRGIEIEAQLKNRQIELDKAVINGASAEIAARGSLDLQADEFDLVVLVAPLKTVDAIVKFTPIISTWLEGTLVSIPVRVSGPFEDPSITPMSPSAVGSSILNLLKNTIKLPVKLVEPLFDEEDDEDEKDGQEDTKPAP